MNISAEVPLKIHRPSRALDTIYILYISKSFENTGLVSRLYSITLLMHGWIWYLNESICQCFIDVCSLHLIYVYTNCAYLCLCEHAAAYTYKYIYIYISVCACMTVLYIYSHIRVCVYFCVSVSEWWQGSKYRGECWEILITQKQCREI